MWKLWTYYAVQSVWKLWKMLQRSLVDTPVVLIVSENGFKRAANALFVEDLAIVL